MYYLKNNNFILKLLKYSGVFAKIYYYNEMINLEVSFQGKFGTWDRGNDSL